MSRQGWYRRTYRRNVVDMHITDIDERFMGQFDAARYVEMLLLAQVQSAVVYAHSHAGLCFYPSKVGPMHGGLRGRDIVAEVVDLCHRSGIHVVLYQSLIHDTWAYRAHPEWRIIGADGKGIAERSRYGVCCPNSPYRLYATAMANEICETFDVEGIRYDMTFWPAVCYCTHCQQRWAQEEQGDLPVIVDWQNPRWVRFARARETWLVEFASLLTQTAKDANPALTVEHQSSTYPLGWRFGVTTRLAAENDFLQGDFYGDALQGSFVRKLFYNLTPARPAGFETSIATDLRDYTALKTEDLLRAKASAALADGCAFVFIDAIDPLGTLNPEVYRRMRRVFDDTKGYEPHLGGELCQDVAVYLSTQSKYDPADNGRAVDDPHLSTRIPHVEAVLSVCKSLLHRHVPFGVITDRNLDALWRHQAVILPNVLMVDQREVDAFRAYVRGGGSLYVSGSTALTTGDGTRQPDFLLADVLGVSYRGETEERFTYIAPMSGYESLYGAYTRRHPPGLHGSQVIVDVRPGTQVLGELVLPYTDPADPIRFASIHNNPPGIYTGHPAVVLNHYGDGRAIYVAGELEKAAAHRHVFFALLQLLVGPLSFEADAPVSVEVTLFDDREGQRFVVNLVNFQPELPNIPVDGIAVRIRLAGRTPKRLLHVPHGGELPYAVKDEHLSFIAPRLETYAMFTLEYDV
jgi:hypothetical protein